MLRTFSNEVSVGVVNYDIEGKIAIITLNRPGALNAINTELEQTFRDTLAKFRTIQSGLVS